MRKFDFLHAVIWCVIALAFFAASAYGLMICDDHMYVALRHEITDGLSFRGIAFAFTDVSQAIWMPLSYLSYMLDHTLGWGAGGMHVQNILWHCAAASFLYAVLLRLFGSRPAALFATLLWAVHPLRVESVVWIASRKDVISTTFLLAALLAWLKASDERGMMSDERKGSWLLLSGGLLILGAMAKPSVMVFPVLAFSIDFLITNSRKPTHVYWNFIVLSAMIGIESAYCQQAGGATAYSGLIPLWYRIVNALSSLTVYIGNIVWPTDLGIQCMIRYPDPPRYSILGAVLLLALAAALVPVAYRRVRAYCASRDWNDLLRGKSSENALLAGAAIFFCSLAPFMGIAGFGVHAFSDRFTLIPTLGISFALCALLSAKCEMRGIKWFKLGAVAACSALLILVTHRQTGFWRDDETLLLHTLKIDREKNIDVHRALAVYYWEEKHDLEKVYEHLKAALDYAWNDDVRDSLSVSAQFLVESCYATGRIDEATKHYIWFKRLDFKRWGNDPSAELLMAEAMDAIYTAPAGYLKRIDEILETLRDFPNHRYIPLTIAYHLAKKTGDKTRLDGLLANAPSPTSAGPYFRARWLWK